MNSLRQMIFIFLFMMLINSKFQCPTFSSGQIKSGNCAEKVLTPNTTNYNWKFTACPAHQYCNFDPNSNTSSCENRNISKLIPGENCTTNSECDSNLCLNASCIGFKEGALCSDDLDCHVGLFCKGETGKKTCTPLIKIGDRCLANYDKCVGNAICSNSFCRKMQSIPINNSADNYLLCESGYTIFADILGGGWKKCIEPFALTNPTTSCNLGDQCLYQSGNYHIAIPCRCGVNSNGAGACGKGSKDLQKHMNNFMSFVQKIWAQPLCHISNHYFCKNVQNIEGFYEAYVGIQLFHDSVYLDPSQDNATKSVIRPDYWDAYSHLPPDSSTNKFDFLVCLVLGIFLFI